ncbi:hypothetical protein EMMF5_005173 [Cystobasidiomycetes sp. EMM_F5]
MTSLAIAILATSAVVAAPAPEVGLENVQLRQATRSQIIEQQKRGNEKRAVYLLTHHCCITNSAGPCAGYGNFGIKVIGYTPYGSYWVGQADAGNGTASPVYVQNAPQATLFTLDPTSCALSSVSAPGSQQAGTANQLYDFTTTSGYAPWMAATTVPSNGARIICYPGADGISLTCHNGLGMTSSSPCVDVSGYQTACQDVKLAMGVPSV